MDIDRARRHLRLRDLETLMAVVEAGAMRKASSGLHRSEPAVSKALRELEDALGLPLLERGRSGVLPTVYGEALVRRSKALIDDLHSALRELEHLADPSSGEVRLGCMETLHAGLVGATIEQLLRAHPRMRFVLESGQANDLVVQFLLERRVDFVIARPSGPLPAEVHGEVLLSDKLQVVVDPEHALARCRRVSLPDLHDAHWILSRNEATPVSPVARAFAAHGLKLPPLVLLSGSLNLRYNLLATGRFVTCVPHSLLPFVDRRRLFRVLPIELPAWDVPTMILTLRGRTPGPSATLFLQQLRELARPLS
jgi:DNA-binding transcriptional LysR family regulator